MQYEKYLPLGTVVLLKEAKKRVMIIGFCCLDEKDKTKVFDYSGCIYPEGMIASDKNLLFNHNQIEKIFHLGYSDEEEKLFKEKLKIVLEKTNLN